MFLPAGMYYYEHSGSKEQIKVIRQYNQGEHCSVISALIILVVSGILIGCYLNEVNLFDGPAADDYLYHANEKITVIALTAIFIIMLAIIKKRKMKCYNRLKIRPYLYLLQ